MAAATRRIQQLVAAHARLLSAAAAGGPPPPPGELPSLKAALRAVYRAVHPDLFQDYQPAKEANTRSFKMLHEYLEAAAAGPKVPLPYRFHFFVREEGSSSTTGSSSGSSGSSGDSRSSVQADAAPAAGAAAQEAVAAGPPPGLREVVLTLPPPTRGAPGQEMSHSTRKAFGSLLAALGLPSRWAGDGEGDAAAAAYGRLVSLREFLPQAVEAVHQHAAEQSGAAHRLAALRTALRLGRRVSVGFGEPPASGGALLQLDLLQRLVAAVDSLPPAADLAGLRVTIGGEAHGVDALGVVWLAPDGSHEAWASQLAAVDATHCRQRQALRQQVQAQEAAVAAALGLGMVYTQRDASLAPDYRQALERLAAAAAARGPLGGGRFRDLPLLLEPPGAEGGGAATGGCAADTEAGLLRAPTAITAEQLCSDVEQLGARVLAAVAARQQREAELAALRTQVERKVMLRRLLREPALSDARYKSCMERMLGSAQKLSGLLHGQAVRVAEVNGLSADRSVIDIAWNWQM